MKNLSKLVVLGGVLAASASFAFADTITLGSFATGTTAASLGFSSSQTATNFAGYTAFTVPPAIASTPALLNGTANTYALSPNGVWASAVGNSSWIGYASTAGPGGTNPAYGYYEFTTDFSAVGGPGYSGSIDVMADDTVEVLLNNSVIVPFGTLGSDAHCADIGPSCLAQDIVSLSGITLLSGNDTNVLTFVVEQAGAEGMGLDPSGVDFNASFSAITPEPSSLAFLGIGLVGAAGICFRRLRTA
jgi:hypothetical protein